MAALKIAIVGAGPAGCMLARLLHQSDQNISVSIFEGEKSLDLRSQGGSLDLHVTSGQAAMKAAGLFEEFQKHARYAGEAIKIADKNLLCYVKQGASADTGSTISSGRPEIDRPVLREILYHSLPDGIVKWDHKLKEIDAERNLHFANGNVYRDFDLVVGADGAWSKVRLALSDVLPYYSGIGGHALSINNVKEEHPELYKLVNRGSVFAFSDGKSLMGQQMGDGSVNVSTWSVRPEDWQKTSGYDMHDAAAVKAACRKEYADWSPELVALVEAASEKAVPRDLYMLPVGHRWDHVPGVTLIGDAAHVMTPFAGEGVNLAFSDCMKLTKAIVSAAAARTSGPSVTSQTGQSKTEPNQYLDKNVKEFEEDMFKRATETQQLTYDMMTAMFFTPGAPRACIERYILRATSKEMGSIARILLIPVVYAWFFVFKLIW